MNDPYKIIGVPRDADMDTVKQAYKKLVLKWHPDRNKDNPEAEAKIREINAAYDEIKNRHSNGSTFSNHSTGGYYSHPDINDILRNFENMFGRGGFSPEYRNRARNVQVQYGMTLEEAFHGKEAELTFKTPNDKIKTVKVKIPPGITDGDTLRCQGQGYSINNGPVSDLLIFINIVPHSQFERRGVNLITNITIDAFEAMIGTERQITTIDGASVTVNIQAGIQANSMLQVRNYGMPYQKSSRGDLIVLVKIVTPVLNQEQIDKLKEFKNQL